MNPDAPVIRLVTGALELGGIAIMGGWAVIATARALGRVVRRYDGDETYERYRRELSRGILLGLELLVGADIIGTVAVEPSFRSVGVLGAIVLIRTFLSFTLEVEVTGRWPWQPPVAESGRRPDR